MGKAHSAIVTMIEKADMNGLLGRGLYTAPQVARLVGVSTSTVRRWMKGYQFSYRTTAGPRTSRSGALIASDLPIIADRAAISFVELVEILVVSAFLSRGLPMRTIRKARRRAASKLETDHPFAYKRFKTDGRGIFIELAEESDTYRPLIELSAGQYGFPQILNRYLEQIDFDVETLMAERWWPLGRGKPIVLDPKVAFGSPVIAETRIPVSAIMDALGTGETRKSICQWYRIGSKDVAAAIAFHRGTRRHEVCI